MTKGKNFSAVWIEFQSQIINLITLFTKIFTDENIVTKINIMDNSLSLLQLQGIKQLYIFVGPPRHSLIG